MAPAQDPEQHERSSSHHGSGEGRGRGRGRGSSRARGGGGRFGSHGQHSEKGGRHRNKEIGRAEWSRNPVDKRARNEDNREIAKRRRIEGKDEQLPTYATRFSQEEIEAQEKKPKRKVAVMIGYSGSGYKGMQLNHQEKTIEGDLFSAFVAAGAISKANADDPKKSSLIRCARTDKGVHAAGNLISLKLIVEDSEVVSRINEQLNPQIRVWGIERTNGSFSAYQHCDSRIYEYLIPTHCFLPPHPKSFLARKLEDLAEEANDRDNYLSRQEEVADFWPGVDDNDVKAIVNDIDSSIRDKVLQIFYEHTSNPSAKAPTVVNEDIDQKTKEALVEDKVMADTEEPANVSQPDKIEGDEIKSKPGSKPAGMERSREPTPIELAIRRLKAAHTTARNGYRIHPARLARVHSAFARFEGSHKFHNYTVEKAYRDPSATRIIKSFTVGEKPLLIGNTEWLSLKVHGQSFMMHQIRKMVSMIALMIRCGCPEERLQDSYLANRMSIPKAPSLGLLLERPVFDVYNEKLEQYGRERIDFNRYNKEIEDFKQREIYERIFREEERDACFHSFFTALDNTRSAQLLYLSSLGFKATQREIPRMDTGQASSHTEKQDIDQVSSDDERRDGEEG